MVEKLGRLAFVISVLFNPVADLLGQGALLFFCDLPEVLKVFRRNRYCC